MKYANKMGHKKSFQRFKKDSAEKLSATQFIKPKNTSRNQVTLLHKDINSKSYIEQHDYEKFETNERHFKANQELIIQDMNEESQTISQER